MSGVSPATAATDRIPQIGGVDTATPAELRAQELADVAATKSLEVVRSSAEKWQTAIASLLGLFTLSGLIKGPDDFAKVDERWQPAIPAFLALAAFSGVLALLLAARAAHGLPQRNWSIGEAYLHARQDAARTAATALWTAINLGLLSFACLATIVGILWFAPRAAPTAKSTLLATDQVIACGPLSAAPGGGLLVRDQLTGSDVRISASELRVVQQVAACPTP
jgi:hypothetical protein